MDLKAAIHQLSENFFKEIQHIRRHLHAHPELSFVEYKTSEYIQSQLNARNIPFQNNIAGTGIIALIKGKNPDSRTVALRADIDALPILEKNTTEYISQNKGIMHACGHDVHSASLLGAAFILNEIKENFEGTIKLIFQPGEEKLPGGASLMIKEGALKDPSPKHIFGQHVYPSLEAGKVGFRAGKYMASSDEIYLTVKGKGGHAALPQLLIDPIVIAAEVIQSLQQLISRNGDPTMPAVLSFGKIEGNGATNVIPDEVYMEGTFRTYDEEWRKKAHEIIKTRIEYICKAHGATADLEIKKGYPHLVNHEALTNSAKALAEEYLGKENIVDLPMRMTAEDFAYYSHEIPACFYRLGTGNTARGITSPVHTANFDIDEKALITGMGLMAWLAIKS